MPTLMRGGVTGCSAAVAQFLEFEIGPKPDESSLATETRFAGPSEEVGLEWKHKTSF